MNILTFDVEEWFHILDNDSTRSEKEWSKFEYRLEANLDRIFSLLDEHNQKATFFCLGWVAKEFPQLIRRIHESGYEIASHSYRHQLAYEQSHHEFRHDLENSINSLEDITGSKVRSYRAPGFSLTCLCGTGRLSINIRMATTPSANTIIGRIILTAFFLAPIGFPF